MPDASAPVDLQTRGTSMTGLLTRLLCRVKMKGRKVADLEPLLQPWADQGAVLLSSPCRRRCIRDCTKKSQTAYFVSYGVCACQWCIRTCVETLCIEIICMHAHQMCIFANAHSTNASPCRVLQPRLLSSLSMPVHGYRGAASACISISHHQPCSDLVHGDCSDRAQTWQSILAANTRGLNCGLCSRTKIA